MMNFPRSCLGLISIFFGKLPFHISNPAPSNCTRRLTFSKSLFFGSRCSPEPMSGNSGLVPNHLWKMTVNAGKTTRHMASMVVGIRRPKWTALLSLPPSGIWERCTAGRASLKQRRRSRSVRWDHDRMLVERCNMAFNQYSLKINNCLRGLR